MNKYIQQFLDDNNLKVNELFKIEGYENEYHFTDDGHLKYKTVLFGYHSSLLADILNGDKKIIKITPIPSEKFIPEENEKYYFVNVFGKISYMNNFKGNFDTYLISHNLVFEIREQAEDYKWFLDKVDEYKKPFVIEKSNYYLYVNLCSKLVCYSRSGYYPNQGTIYFGDEKNISEFIKEVGEKRIKKYMFDIWE